jgi:hypothetical protein
MPVMVNPYGVLLDDESLRWAAAESVSEAVIAAICLLETRSVDEIVARLTPAELEQVIKIVGRCPRCYPPGAYDPLKGHRRTPSPKPQPIPGPERPHRSAEQPSPPSNTGHRWMLPRRFAGFGDKAPLNASHRATANPFGMTLDYAWTEWAAEYGVGKVIDRRQAQGGDAVHNEVQWERPARDCSNFRRRPFSINIHQSPRRKGVRLRVVWPVSAAFHSRPAR